MKSKNTSDSRGRMSYLPIHHAALVLGQILDFPLDGEDVVLGECHDAVAGSHL